MSVCDECHGSGREYQPECEYCMSNGWVDDPEDGGTMVCPECDGDSAAEEECENCEGEGEVDD